MPIVNSNYQASGLFKNGHFSTIYSAKLRLIGSVVQERERLTLPDGDFLDLDRSSNSTSPKGLAILLHGLEGNAQRTYMRGQAHAFLQEGWDLCSVNFRGCSGEPNKAYGSYNAGRTDDLQAVLQHLSKESYQRMVLVGFSLGGNLLLKYLGEGRDVPANLQTAVAISSPLNLKGSLDALTRAENVIYRTVFLQNLKRKYRKKMKDYPERMPMSDYKQINSLLTFDHIYTAKAHGFDDAYDYYAKSSSLQFLPEIQIPVLILNAQNDSFLSPECYPISLASNSKNIYLEVPKHGGHVGFHQGNKRYYSEGRAIEFINETLGI